MREDTIRLVRPWLRLAFWLLVTAITLFALRELLPLVRWVFQVMQPFLIALIVAYVFHPVVTFVQKKLHLGRVAGIAVLVLSIAVMLIGVMIWLMPVLYRQIVSMVKDLNDLPAIIKSFMDRYNYDPEIVKQVQEKLTHTIAQLRLSVDQILTEIGSIKPVAQGGLSAVKSVAGGLFGVVGGVTAFLITTGFVTVISFYYLVDMDAIPHIIRRLLPPHRREEVWNILGQADQSVGGFLRGQLIACIIVAVLTSILLFFIGMKQYAILIGSFAGIMHLIPYLGPIAGGTPAVLFVLLSQQFANWRERGLYFMAVLIGFSVIEAFDGLVTQPYIVGRRASLHPLAVMLALVVGAQFGLGGMIIAVPVMCFVRVLWMELFWRKRIEPPLDEIS